MHCKRVIIGDVHLLNRRYRQPVSTHWSQEQTHLLFPPPSLTQLHFACYLTNSQLQQKNPLLVGFAAKASCILGFSLFGLGIFLRRLFTRVTFYLLTLFQLPKLNNAKEEEKLSIFFFFEFMKTWLSAIEAYPRVCLVTL